MKRLVLCTSIVVSILAGCGAAAPSAAPTQDTASTPAPVATLGATPSPNGAIGGTVDYVLDGSSTTTDVDAVADGASVSGTAVTTFGNGTHTVRLECAARDGDTWAFGGTTEQTTVPGESAGYWSAIVVKDGPPQQIGIWLSDDKLEGIDCIGWLTGIDLADIGAENYVPVESGALVPPPDIAPSAPPSASAVFPSWYTGGGNGAGILTAGSQTTKSFVPGFTLTVPEGWVNSWDEAGFYGLFQDTPANAAEFAVSEGMAHEIHMGPRNDPYFTCDAWEDNQGATAAEIVVAAVANEALATSEPVDVTIGGLTGKQIDVQLDPGWTDSCPGDPPGLDLRDGRTRAILLDTADRGVLVIFVGSLHSAGHEAFLAEAMPIVESFQFDTGQ